MARLDALKHTAAPVTAVPAPESDYGSDLDESLVNDLLSKAESQPQPVHKTVITSIEDPVLQNAPTSVQRSVRFHHIGPRLDAPLRSPSVEIEYDERNRRAFSPSRLDDPVAEAAVRRDASDAPEQPGEDKRSPIARFRTAPKKPFSVTDFVSPAWCEQQYWYSLTRYGRVKRTPAMKQGSAVHKLLEDQVHKEVKVEVVTREDAFGLRMWNVIQGLRTLRATGMTRELEVWGFVDGELMNGIIDEVNTTCPDEEAEEKMLMAEKQAKETGIGGRKKKPSPLETNQSTLQNFLTSQNASVLESSSPWIGTLHEKPRIFYITDIKTRQSRSLPAEGSQSKPVYIQLMLYRRLLSALAANDVEAEQVFSRYRLDSTATFSDTFIAEVSQLDFQDYTPSEDEMGTPFQSSQDSTSELLAHNTLSLLWAHMISEFALAIPSPAPQSKEPVISNLMTAQYRTPSSGTLIGVKPFVYQADVIEPFIEDELKWWRGERATKGVDIEDAFKCRFCEFSEGCGWRKEKIEEATQKARLRKGVGRRRSEV